MKKGVLSIFLAAALASSTLFGSVASAAENDQQYLIQEETSKDVTGDTEDTADDEALVEVDEILDEADPLQELSAEDADEQALEEVTEEDDLSSTADHSDSIVMSECEFNNGLTDQAVKYADKKVLLIEDNVPWSNGNNVSEDSNRKVLNALASYDVVTTTKFATLDIHDYSVIILANDQRLESYKQYDSFKDKMEQFAYDGGVVVFGACDGGWASGQLTTPLPGGVRKERLLMNYNRIVNDKHPIVTGELTDGNKLTNSDLYNNYCSHDYFIESTFPEGTQIILEDTNSHPTLIEYPLGNGRVIASGLTWEHSYRLGGSNRFGQKAMDDLFAYALNISGIGNDNLNFINDLQIASDEHYVIVMDAVTQKPISGVSVKGTPVKNGKAFSVKTDSHGRAKVSKVKADKYEVVISKKGYYNKTTYYDVAGGKYRILYMNSEVKGKFELIDAIFWEHKDGKIDVVYDVKETTANIKPDHTSTLYLKATWPGKEITDYVVYRNGKYAYSTDGRFTIENGKFSNAKGDKVSFSDGRLSVRVIAKDGTRSEGVELLLYARKQSEGDLWGGDNKKQFSIGQKMSFTVPDKYPVIGNTDFNLDLKMIPFSYQVNDDEVVFVFGITDYFKNKDPQEAWKSYKKKYDDVKRTQKLKEVMQAFGAKSGSIVLKQGWDTDLSVSGYAKGKFDPDTGTVTEISGELSITAEAMYKYNQQFFVGAMPFYFEIGGGFELNDTPKIKGIMNDENRVVVDNTLTLTPKFSIGGGVGLNGAASVGAEGEASLPIVICDTEWDVSRNKTRNLTNVSLAGEMKLKASLLFVFKAEHSIAKGEWQLFRYYWDTGETEWFDNHSLLEQAAEFDVTDTGAYMLMDRNYLQQASEWYTNMLTAQAYEDNMTILKSGIMPTMQPVVEYLGDDRAIMVFQDDNASRSSANRSTLMYSVLENGVWSEPKAVWDNGTADGAASIATGADGTYVVWQKMNKELGDEVTVDEMAACSEIAVARFDEATETFTDAKFVTSDDKLQMVPVAAVGNNPYAIYVENSDNALVGGGTNTIYAVNLVNGQTTTIYNGTGYVSTIDAFVDGNNNLNVGMSLDTDGDMNTLTDTEIFVYNGVLEQITKDDKAQVNAQYSNGVLYYYDAEEACVKSYSKGKTDVVVESNGEISQNFRIFDNGEKKAVAWIGISDNLEKKNGILAKVNLGNGWSEPVEIVSSQQQIMLFDGFVSEDSAWHFAATAYDSDGTPLLAYTDALPYVTTSATDISTTSRSHDVENYSLDLLFENGCEDRIEKLNVEFRDPETDEEYYSVVAKCDVPGGAKQTIHLDVDIPLQFEETTYDIYVYPDGEVDLSDNHELVTFGQSKMDITVDHKTVGDEEIVDVCITNEGEFPFNGKLYIKENNPDNGNLIQAMDIKELAAGSTQAKTIRLDLTQIRFGDEPSKTYYFVLEDENRTRYLESIEISNPYYVGEEEPSAPTELVVNTPDPVELNLLYNNQYQLKPSVAPRKAAQWPILYTSSDEAVAVVDEKGLITAVGEGKAEITVTAKDTELSEKVNLVVTQTVHGKISIGLDEITPKTSSYQVSDEYQINVFDGDKEVLPSEYFEYKVSNSDVAFITEAGTIKLLKAGKVKLTVVNKKTPAVKADMTLAVTDKKLAEIKLGYNLNGSNYSKDSHVFTEAELKSAKLTLAPVLYAENGSVLNDEKSLSGIKYASSNKKVAKVDAKGVVTGVGGKGTAVITVSVAGSKVTKSFTIYCLEANERQPEIVSGQTLDFNVAKNETLKLEIQPIAGSSISSVYGSLYKKNGKTYEAVPGFSVSTYKTTDSYGKICNVTANATAKAGQYYVLCYSGGNAYYLPVKVTVKNVQPKVSVKIDPFNAFYRNESGKVTITTDEEITSTSMSIVSEKGKSSAGYTWDSTNLVVKANYSAFSSAENFSKYSQKYSMSVYLKNYRQPVVVTGTIPAKYVAPTVKIEPASIQPDKGGATTYNLKATVTGTDLNGGCSVSASQGSVISVKEAEAGTYNIVYSVSVPKAKTTVNLSFRNSSNWAAAVPATLTVMPYSKKNATYKVEKNIEYNPLTKVSTKVRLMSGKASVALRDAAFDTPDGMFTIVSDKNEGIYVVADKNQPEYTAKSYSYKVPLRSYDGNVDSEFDIVIKISAKEFTASTSAKTLYLDASAKGHILRPDILIDKMSVSEFKTKYGYATGIKTIKVGVTKGKTVSTDLFAQYDGSDTIKLFNNRVCEGNYVVSVTPVLEDGTELNVVKYNVRATKKKASIKVTSSGSLDVRKRSTSTAKLFFTVSNNSASISKVTVDNSFAHAIAIAATDYSAKKPSVTLSLKHYERIATGKYSLPLNVVLSDGSKVQTTAIVNVTSSKVKVNAPVITLTRAANPMMATTQISFTTTVDDEIHSIVQTSVKDKFEVVDNGNGEITVKAAKNADIKAGTYTISLEVSTSNAASNEAPIKTTVKVTVK